MGLCPPPLIGSAHNQPWDKTKVWVGRPVHIWPGLRSEVFTFPDDVNRDGSENIRLLTIQPLEMVASLQKIYWFQCTYELQKLTKNQVYSRYEQKWFETGNFPGPSLKAIALRPFLGNLLLTLSRQMTYACHAVSPLNNQRPLKRPGGGVNSGIKDLIPVSKG